jgi:hypothetical protein
MQTAVLVLALVDKRWHWAAGQVLRYQGRLASVPLQLAGVAAYGVATGAIINIHRLLAGAHCTA